MINTANENSEELEETDLNEIPLPCVSMNDKSLRNSS